MATILIAEDNATNMKLATLVLRRAGFEVIQADDGPSSVSLTLKCLPDLVLMDVQLPGLDGISAMRQLKADPLTSKIPVIATTAHAMQGDEQRFRAAGCDGYIAKPYSHRHLIDLIQASLGAPPAESGALENLPDAGVPWIGPGG